MHRWLVLLLPLVASACDPCGGVGVCGAPQVRYDGEVVRSHSENPAERIRVEFVRTGGVELEEPVVRAESDATGRFRLAARARGEGQVVGDLTLYPPSPIPPVRVPGIRMATTRAAGEARYAGRWEIPYPHLPYEASFYHRGSLRAAAGIEVEFRRTGGIPVYPDTFRVTTDAWGNVKLRPRVDTMGEVTAELVVHPLPPFRPFTIGNLRLRTVTGPRLDSTVVRTGLGPHLPYAGTLVWQGSGAPAAGIELEFRRTGGVPLEREPYRATTDAFGTFWLTPVPLSAGELQGDLVVRAPAAHAGYRVAQLRLPTHELDGAVQHLGALGIPRR